MCSMILWISKVLSVEIEFFYRFCDLCFDLIYDFVLGLGMEYRKCYYDFFFIVGN